MEGGWGSEWAGLGGDSEIGEGDDRALHEKLSRLVNMPADAFVEQMSADPERFQRWIMQRAAQAQAQARAARGGGGDGGGTEPASALEPGMRYEEERGGWNGAGGGVGIRPTGARAVYSQDTFSFALTLRFNPRR